MDERFNLALIGNIANNFFRDATLLNRGKYLSAICYVNSGASTPNTERPESDPSTVSINWQEYTHEVLPLFGIKLRMLMFPRFILKRFKGVQSNFIHEAERADLRVFSGNELLIAPKFRGPYVIRPTGSDLTVFPSLSFKDYWIIKKGSGRAPLKDKVIWMYLRFYYRKAYRKAAGIALSSEIPYRVALQSFMPKTTRIVSKIPLAIDTNSFRKVEQRSNLLPEFVRDDDFMIFMPSRVMISSSDVHKKTGQWKASDVGLYGLRIFLDSLTAKETGKIWLMIPDRKLSDELPKAKSLINDLNLDENIIWLKGANSEGLTRAEMIPLYSNASVTMDDFGAGWYGSVAVEAMACESPVLTYITDKLLRDYDNPPMLIAQSPKKVAEHLSKLFYDRSNVKNIGKESRAWVQKNHTETSVQNSYISILESINQATSKNRAQISKNRSI
jgi:glycosyltransferase involved in cell wall biosynthesis